MFTKQHYEFFAQLLKDNYEVSTEGCKAMLRDMADQMAQYFAQDNERFDRARFIKATGITT